MAFCPNCGSELRSIAAQCFKCGTTFDEDRFDTGSGWGPVEQKPSIEPTYKAKLLEVQALKHSTNWFLEIQTSSGERHLCDKKRGFAILRNGILEGTFNAKAPLTCTLRRPGAVIGRRQV